MERHSPVLLVPDADARQTARGWPAASAWARARAVRFVFLDGSAEAPQAPTQAKVLTAGGVLHFRFACSDPDVSALVYSSLGRDSERLWRDDRVEVLLHAGSSGGTGFHFMVNAGGGLLDARVDASGNRDVSWDPPVRRRVSHGQDGWTAQLAVPLHCLAERGPVRPLWRCSLLRSRQGREGAFAEDTGWPGTGRASTDAPSASGWLRLAAAERPGAIGAAAEPSNARRNPLGKIRSAARLAAVLRGAFGRPVCIAGAKGAAIQLARAGWDESGDCQATTARVTRTASRLSIAVLCAEHDVSSIIARPGGEAIWNDDSVEIFLAPQRKESPDYLHVIVNAAGALYLGWGKRPAAVNGITARVSRAAGSWQATVKVPFAAFGLSPGKIPALWGLNVVRNRPARPEAPPQQGVWSRPAWSAHDPASFGTLWLERADVLSDLGSRLPVAELARRGAERLAGTQRPAPEAVRQFDWDVLTAQQRRELKPPSMVHHHLAGIRDRQFAQRDLRWQSIRSWEEWLKWKEKIRRDFYRSIGAMPRGKAGLRPRVTVAFENDLLRVERLIYESRQGFHVTANVFLPARPAGEAARERSGSAKLPAVVWLTGHATAGRLSGETIRNCVDLALSGYFVLSLDLVGQGERIYVNNGHGSKTPTSNHYAMGAPCFLTGSNLANYMIHDVMRGLDYLEGRAEVDMGRVVVTGASGGGTMTAYVCALDDRPCAVAPVSALGSFRRGGGNYDSEQVLYDCCRSGMDPEGLCALIAPRPLCIICEVGSKEHERLNRASYDVARRIYALQGAADKLVYLPTAGPHGYGRGHYQRFRRWLAEVLPPNADTPKHTRRKPQLPPELLRASKTGRAFFSRELKGRETVFSLNAKRITQPLAFDGDIRTTAQAKQRAEKIAGTLRRLLELEDAGAFAPAQVQQVGQGRVAGRRMEKLILETEPGVLVPAVFFPAGAGSAARPGGLWLADRGKRELLLRRWREIAGLLDGGVSVMLADLRGMGETAAGADQSFFGPETGLNGFSYRLGTPLIGMRVRDALCCVSYLRSRKDLLPGRVGIIGDSFSPTNPPEIRQPRLRTDPGLEPLANAESVSPILAILASALDGRIACCAARGAIASYASLCDRAYFYHPMGSFVPGILRHFDVADVVGCSAPRPVMLAASVNGWNQTLDGREARSCFQRAARAFRLHRAANHLRIAPSVEAYELPSFVRKALG